MLRGGNGEFLKMLWRARGCVYGAIWNWLPIVFRRRGVRGVPLFPTLASNVNTLGSDCSLVPADCGGVNVNAEALACFDSAGPLTGVVPGSAELGVSGYVIVKGPGVCVRRAGGMYPGPSLVSNRKEVGLALLASGGAAVLGEEATIAAAYAFESVLNAVGEDGSTSVFSAVDDFPNVIAVAGVFI